MKELTKKELKEIIQSGHINLLIGSGCSQPYLSTLADIEKRMNSEDDNVREQAQKEYLSIISKSKAILNPSLETDKGEKKKLDQSKNSYDNFVGYWVSTITKRSLSIVSKQINAFSTNFDMFLEESCERMGVPYNDGFAGQIKPKFNASNFNKVQRFKSLQFDNTSDIPLFNIIKLHGSLSWRISNDDLVYSDGGHIQKDLDQLTGDDFADAYKDQLALINPNAEKHFETVLDVNYASLLRKFTLELEKENSVLFIFGFSLADRHIRDLLYGAMKTNPTLVVVYFAYSEYDVDVDEKEEAKNPNLYIISPPADEKMPFSDVTSYLEEIFKEKSDKSEEQDEEPES